MDSVITLDPTLDPATGKFSGPFPPANGAQIELRGPVRPVRSLGVLPGSAVSAAFGHGSRGVRVNYTYEAFPAPTWYRYPSRWRYSRPHRPAARGTALPLSERARSSGPRRSRMLLARFGVHAGVRAVRSDHPTAASATSATNAFGRGCQSTSCSTRTAATTAPAGSRAPTRPRRIPTAGNVAGGDATNNNNAGELPGVLTIQSPAVLHPGRWCAGATSKPFSPGRAGRPTSTCTGAPGA